METLILEKDTLKKQDDHIGNKCTLVCFNVLSSVLLDKKKSTNNNNNSPIKTYILSPPYIVSRTTGRKQDKNKLTFMFDNSIFQIRVERTVNITQSSTVQIVTVRLLLGRSF